MDERSNMTGQRIDRPFDHGEGVPQTFDPVVEAKGQEWPSLATHNPHEAHRHPIGAGVGALLAAGTGGATGGVIGGPVGAVVGAVIGAIAGSYGGKAIAELADPAVAVPAALDDYTSRIHCSTSMASSKEPQDSTIPQDTRQAPRETWSWLDQSPKELLTGESAPPSDS